MDIPPDKSLCSPSRSSTVPPSSSPATKDVDKVIPDKLLAKRSCLSRSSILRDLFLIRGLRYEYVLKVCNFGTLDKSTFSM